MSGLCTFQILPGQRFAFLRWFCFPSSFQKAPPLGHSSGSLDGASYILVLGSRPSVSQPSAERKGDLRAPSLWPLSRATLKRFCKHLTWLRGGGREPRCLHCGREHFPRGSLRLLDVWPPGGLVATEWVPGDSTVLVLQGVVSEGPWPVKGWD